MNYTEHLEATANIAATTRRLDRRQPPRKAAKEKGNALMVSGILSGD